jgi:protein-S-isoprenylcysteine O-methyltransferase Ste14
MEQAGNASRKSSRALAFVFGLLPVLAAGGILLPFLLFAFSAPFPGRALGTAIYLLFCLEKIWAMYFRMKDKRVLEPQGDWTAVTVGFSYSFIVYAVVLEFYARRTGIAFPALCGAGAVLYAAAVAIRYWAFRSLGKQWAIHVDKSLVERSLVRTGPYRRIRHPLYLGAMLEVAAMPLMLGAFWTLLCGLVVFIPLEIHRAYYEERHLRRIFGAAYDDYASEVWAFFPLPFGKSRSPR